MSAIEVTDQDFAQTISEGTVLVDFWAPWCAPCKMQGPIVEQVGEAMAGKARVAKLNVDEGREIAMKYGIQSIPTLMIFKDGEMVQKLVGLRQKNDLIAALNNHL